MRVHLRSRGDQGRTPQHGCHDRHIHARDLACCSSDPGGTCRRSHHSALDRSHQDVAEKRGHQKAHGGRDSRVRADNLLGQDGHADTEQDDRHGLRRKRQGPDRCRDGALLRRGAQDNGRRRRGRGRTDRGSARGILFIAESA